MSGQWLVPWIAVTDPRNALAWARELNRECPVGHVLYGQEATFLARRQNRDDFLVALVDGRVAEVHLTWSEEKDPRWPAANIYADLETWQVEVMVPDHEDWQSQP